MVTRSRWTKTARSYMEKLQREALEQLGIDADEWIGRKVSEDAEVLWEELSHRLGGSPDPAGSLAWQKSVRSYEPPTKFDNPTWSLMLERYIEQIERGLRQLDSDVPRTPLFTSIPWGGVDAISLAVPRTSDHVIAFPVGMFHFINGLAKAACLALALEDTPLQGPEFHLHPGAISLHLEETPDALIRAGELYEAYLVKGDPSLAIPYLLDGERLALQGFLLPIMELFVIGHEYGHIVKGHLKSKKPARREAGSSSWDEYLYDAGEELQADAFGLAVAGQAIGEVPIQWLKYAGPTLLLHGFDVAQRITDLLRHGEETEPIQPDRVPAGFRHEFLRDTLLEKLPEQAQPWIEAFEYFLDSFFEFSYDRWVDFHQAGRRPFYDV